MGQKDIQIALLRIFADDGAQSPANLHNAQGLQHLDGLPDAAFADTQLFRDLLFCGQRIPRTELLVQNELFNGLHHLLGEAFSGFFRL